MRSSLTCLWVAAGTALLAQAPPPQLLEFRTASGSPLTVVGTELGDSRVQNRGGAMVLDLHATVTLRNNGTQNVRGVTLLVLAQEMTPGGKGSVAVPSLNVPPGRNFPVKINLRLLRPLPAPAGPLVEVGIDGVLFSDLTFFGPNRLESRRVLTAWELEARRDREYLKAVLDKQGAEGLRQEMLASMARQQARPRLDVQVSRGPNRAISAAVNALTGKNVSFAFLKLPGAPLDPLTGVAHVSADEAGSPQIEVTNRSNRPVRYFEVGWIVKDAGGREYLAGTIPPETATLDLRPGKTAGTQQGRTYKLGSEIASMSGFISQVEFADGSLWIPSRKALGEGSLLGILPASPEEQRLGELYRNKGLQALAEELGKF
jgi:hypothetical protein